MLVKVSKRPLERHEFERNNEKRVWFSQQCKLYDPQDDFFQVGFTVNVDNEADAYDPNKEYKLDVSSFVADERGNLSLKKRFKLVPVGK